MPSISKQPEYWRSLAELDLYKEGGELDEFIAREYPDAAADSGFSRRRFVQLMGASFAFAGVGCQRWEQEEIVPLGRRPEGFVPGNSKEFNTAMELGGVAVGLRVTAYDGRPIKIDGNPDHPFTGSASTALAQASILELYDPDRSKTVRKGNTDSSYSSFAGIAKDLKPDTRLTVLSEASASPTILSLREALFLKFSNFQWHEYEPLSRDNEREGTRLAFGAPHRPIAKLDKAKIILALDSDFLVDHPAALRYARDFAGGRRPEDGAMSRVYAVESTFSNTGALADHRLPLRSELILPFVMALEAKLSGGKAPPTQLGSDTRKFIAALAADLLEHKGSCAILSGHRQPPAVHALVAKLNDLLQATVSYALEPDPERATHVDAIAAVARELRSGKIDTLVILGGNPVYDAPSDVDFAGALSSATKTTTVHLSPYNDETSALCTWHIARAHYLEAWGDARSFDGTVSIVQPLIDPIYGSKSSIEVLATLVGDKSTGHELVRKTAGGSMSSWRKALHDGHAVNSAYEQVQPALLPLETPTLTKRQQGNTNLADDDLEIIFTSSSHTYDGRFANNGWLQETPDFMTKLTWDNAALVSPKTAEKLNLKHEELIRFTAGGGEVVLPVYVMPGQALYSIAVALGHGRTHSGHVGGATDKDIAPVGFNTYGLRVSASMYIGSGLQTHRTGGTYPLATTQDHWAMDKVGRDGIKERLDDLIRTTTESDVAKDDFGYHPHGPKLESLWVRHETLTHESAKAGKPTEESKSHRWGMATDLSTCMGCNACVVACQAENNIPIVGKDQVRRSREMSWIRIDRYFKGDPDNPQIAHQPLACQHCEMAPCEEVCPVGATIHTDEGINDMIYNRCIGTRYCANNCPYRVRRFNFFHWQAGKGGPNQNSDDPRNKIRQLLFNPEVTVRSRGVMEKCTFCIQRIERAKIEHHNNNTPIPDGEIKTACMQACPTDSIVFGDLADPESRVSRLHNKKILKRGYALLAEFNTAPRNIYLARVRNPNETLEPPAKNKVH